MIATIIDTGIMKKIAGKSIMGNESQLLSALFGGCFVGLYLAGMTYIMFPKFVKRLCKKHDYCEPLQYVRIKAKY